MATRTRATRTAPPSASEGGAGTLFVLAGPVGAGKTTVARALAPRLPAARLATIEGDAFWPFVARSDRPRRDDFHALLRATTGAAVQFARAGFDVLLDFSMPPGFLHSASRIAREVAIDYVVLCPPLATCAARAAARPEGTIADYAPHYAEFHALFAGVGRHAVDEGEDAQATAARIAQGLADGRFRLPPQKE